MRKSVYSWFIWITNNESRPRHEIEFDVAFFIINTIALVFGSIFLYIKGDWQWIAFLIIEYNWALDNCRNNRNY